MLEFAINESGQQAAHCCPWEFSLLEFAEPLKPMGEAHATAVYSRREQRGWYFYDWANSAFSTTVITLFLGPYLTALARAGAGADGYVHRFGLPVDPRSY